MLGLARTTQMAAWQGEPPHPNARRAGSASTNASVTYTATSAVTSTSQFQFGTASEYVDTSSQYITTTGGTRTYMNYGTGEFSIEFWIYIPTVGSGHSASCDLLSNDTAGGFGIRLAKQYNNSGLGSGTPQYIGLFARAQADLDYWDLGASWPASQWNFVAIQRKSTTMSCWVNGTLLTRSDGPDGSWASRSASSGTTIRIGTADGSNGVGPAYIDEVCFSNTYRYNDTTIDIPIPAAAFTVDSYTTQLLHMDGTNGGTSFVNATA